MQADRNVKNISVRKLRSARSVLFCEKPIYEPRLQQTIRYNFLFSLLYALNVLVVKAFKKHRKYLASKISIKKEFKLILKNLVH